MSKRAIWSISVLAVVLSAVFVPTHSGVNTTLMKHSSRGLPAMASTAPWPCGGVWYLSPAGNSQVVTLQAVTVISADDAWAVGAVYYQPVSYHFDGSSWSVVPMPLPANEPNGGVYGLAAASSSDIWAVGNYWNSTLGAEQPLIEHWNGSSWSVISSPNASPYSSGLYGVTAVSSSDVWAVGGFQNTQGRDQTLVEHWNGSQWAIVSSPNPDGTTGFDNLTAVTAVSSTDVWAVGSATPTTTVPNNPLIEQWNGKSWHVVLSPTIVSSGAELTGVAAAASNDVWAVGSFSDVNNIDLTYTLTEHWNGRGWTVIGSPDPSSTMSELRSVAVNTAGDAMAVGMWQAQVGSSTYDMTLTEHWNGTRWSVVSSANEPQLGDLLYSIASATAGDYWAVGSGTYPLIEHYVPRRSSGPCIQ